MKEQFINCYPLSKTLRFSLIPVGKTEDNFNKKLLLESDKQRAENYENVKSYIDRFHKEYIKSALANARIEKINEYAALYWKSNKDDSDAKAMESLEDDIRKQISKQLTSTANFKRLFGKELICEGFTPKGTKNDRWVKADTGQAGKRESKRLPLSCFFSLGQMFCSQNG